MNRDPLQDGISNVQIIDVLGTDLTVVNAARVSMSKESEWDYIEVEGGDQFCTQLKPRLPDADAKLIRYLARHNHWTPFSHPQVSLRIKMPIFIARQWFKHQIGFTRNEVSRRYVDETPEFYVPKEWRTRAVNVKQGSSEQPCEAYAREWYSYTIKRALTEYEEMLHVGVAPEMARMVLPQATYTEVIETGSLAAYARLAKLRLDPHAQLEVRQYAQAVAELIEPHFPVSWKELIQ